MKLLLNLKLSFNYNNKFFNLKNHKLKWGLGIGDWGLGIGDWAQSPIPNPQSPNIFILIINKCFIL